jgi:hypothetical protein
MTKNVVTTVRHRKKEKTILKQAKSALEWSDRHIGPVVARHSTIIVVGCTAGRVWNSLESRISRNINQGRLYHFVPGAQ